MRIVDPTHGTAPARDADVPATDQAPPGSLCGFSNAKPGASEMLTEIGRRLTDRLGPVGFAAKPNAATAADPEQLDHLAARYRLAVVAVGD